MGAGIVADFDPTSVSTANFRSLPVKTPASSMLGRRAAVGIVSFLHSLSITTDRNGKGCASSMENNPNILAWTTLGFGSIGDGLTGAYGSLCAWCWTVLSVDGLWDDFTCAASDESLNTGGRYDLPSGGHMRRKYPYASLLGFLCFSPYPFYLLVFHFSLLCWLLALQVFVGSRGRTSESLNFESGIFSHCLGIVTLPRVNVYVPLCSQFPISSHHWPRLQLLECSSHFIQQERCGRIFTVWLAYCHWM